MTSDDQAGPVLIAYDGSDYAKAGIAQAGRQLAPGRKAIVLTVWRPLGSFPVVAGPIGVVPTEVFDAVKAEGERMAGEGAELARAAGFDAEPATAEGDAVWRVILEVADQRNAGLVVIGSHGRTGLDFVLLGSVATAVAQHSPRPVLIAKADPS